MNLQVYAIKDVGPYDLYTVIVIPPNHDPERPLRGFHYSIGADLPGLVKVTACRSDTNMRVAGELVDETMVVDTVEWRLPALILAKYQADGKDYTVSSTDRRELTSKARLHIHIKDAFHVPFEKGELDAAGGLGATCPTPAKVDLGRLEHFWAELTFPGGGLQNDHALVLFVTLHGERARGVQ